VRAGIQPQIDNPCLYWNFRINHVKHVT
jgi:hypothetical protein